MHTGTNPPKNLVALVVFNCLCAGEDVPPSFSDADEGYQWEVQTDEGWILYWDSLA
jgi:hypothetical protein